MMMSQRAHLNDEELVSGTLFKLQCNEPAVLSRLPPCIQGSDS